MDVEIKNVKVAQHLSEETTAFTASLYIDGKRVGTAQNHGTGGCTLVTSLSPEAARTIAAAEQHFKARTATLDMGPGETAQEVQDSLDFKIDRLVERHEYERDLKRVMRNKTLFLHSSTLYTSPATSSAVKARYPDAKILNDLPFADAVDLYRDTIRAQAYSA